MIREIRCPLCGELLVTIEKEIITSDDIELYQETVNCNKHPIDTPPIEELP